MQSATMVSRHDQREAEHAFHEGERWMKKGDLVAAEGELAAAERLEPSNLSYIKLHAEVRAATIRKLLEDAAAARNGGDREAASRDLAVAERIDPANSLVQQEAEVQSTFSQNSLPVAHDASKLRIESGLITLAPKPGKQEIHYRGSQRDLVIQVFRQFGITATVDQSVPTLATRAETEPLDFAHAAKIVMMLADSFYVPLDPHRVLVAHDTKENRAKFEREFVETVYLPGLTNNEMQDTQNILRNILQVTQVANLANSDRLEIRAPQHTLELANSLLADLWKGNSQVLLTMTVFEVQTHHENDVGAQLPSQVSLYNIPSLEASLFSQYAAEIQQLIASGAVPADNPLAILAALVAAGVLNTPPFNEGFVVFGGGLTATAATTSGATGNFSLNSSEVRQVDKIQMRVGNQEQATFRDGSRYPIITSSFSAAATVSPLAGANIPGYSALVNSANTLAAAPPSIQYEDLGLTLKAKPTVEKDRGMSLQLELTISSLGGSSLNGNPILNNRELKTTVSLKDGEQSVLAGTMSKNEMKSLTGIPFLNDIPGFPATNVDKAVTTDELVIVLTPHIVRLDHAEGASPLYPVPLH